MESLIFLLFRALKFKRLTNSGPVPRQVHPFRLHDALLQDDAQQKDHAQGYRAGHFSLFKEFICISRKYS